MVLGTRECSALKLLLVPCFLLLVSLAGRRWGAHVAGWLAELPVVAGPILYFLALEQGPQFASRAASAALAAILASVSFSVVYSHFCHLFRWPLTLLVSLGAWFAAALLLSMSPSSVLTSIPIALATLLLAPHAFPKTVSAGIGRHIGRIELGLRMLAGATLTVAVTFLASFIGPAWSGLLAVFPVLGIVLAVFSHRAHGASFAIALLRAMATGLYSFFVFCLVLAVALPHVGISGSFAIALTMSLAVQTLTGQYLTDRSRRSPTAAPEL